MMFVNGKKRIDSFLDDERGVAMTEAIIVIPILTLIAVAVLEFGNVFWQREQIETGLRDATRYMARCRHSTAICEQSARNLAYYGTVAGTGSLRAPGWDSTNAPINFSQEPYLTGDVQITATTVHNVIESPLFGFLGLEEVSVRANHSQRVIGW